MRKVCSYCLNTHGHADGRGITHGVCPRCQALPPDVRDEIARLIRDVREREGLANLQAPLYRSAGGDVRLTRANVGALVAMGVQASNHELLYLGIHHAEAAACSGQAAS